MEVWCPYVRGTTIVLTQPRIKGEAFIIGNDIEGDGDQSKESSGVRTVKSELGSRMRVVKEEGRDKWSWKTELTGNFGNISPGMRGKHIIMPSSCSATSHASSTCHCCMHAVLFSWLG